MARDSMDVPQLLRNRGTDGDMHILCEALGALVEGTMGAEGRELLPSLLEPRRQSEKALLA